MSASEISAVVVVKNEAPHLRECLEQLRFAREIVVVDMGSNDGSLEIARDLADKVIFHDGGPHGLIHVNKNRGFAEARGPWILNLDVDERLTPALRDELLQAVGSAPPEVSAFALPFTHYFFGKYLKHGGFQGSLIRLFRKGKLRYPEDRAHSTPQVHGEVRELKSLVVHFNHRTLADFVRKMNLYTSADAALMLEHQGGGLRNRPLPKSLVWAMARAPASIFWKRFVRHGGFRDGVHGFVAAVLLGYYQAVEYAKVWELRNAGGRTQKGTE